MCQSQTPRPWVSGILSLVVPGLGQLHSGRARRAFAIAFMLTTVIFPLTAFALFISKGATPVLVAVPIFSFLVWILIVIDAVSIARRGGPDLIVTRPHWVIYLVFLAVAILLQAAVSHEIKSNWIRAYKIPTGSMHPTFEVGDYILVQRNAYRDKPPRRGDLIVVSGPRDVNEFVKRCVAVEGDTIRSIGHVLYVNGAVQEEPYANYDSPPAPGAADWGPVIVPPHSVFVLGDNRNFSVDSRTLGAFDQDHVKGLVVSIYWSWDSHRMRPRFSRIGRLP